MSGKQILINGGHKLIGNIHNQSSKNAILPIIASSVLVDGIVRLKNTPKLLDIDNMLKIVGDLGVKVKEEDGAIELDCREIKKTVIDAQLSKRLRSSIFMLGPMLARFKRVTISHPGGCDIGNRPIDLHLSGLRDLGVEITERHSLIICDGKNMHSGTVHLDFASVGATENLIMASVFLKGNTRLINVAKEPEIIDLQNFLNSIGCVVSGAGTSEIEIEGVESVHGIEYEAIGDRIAAGTYLIATAMTGGDVNITNINPNYLTSILQKLKIIGCEIDRGQNNIHIKSDGRLNSLELIETRVYPGFPTDLQAQFMALETISNGVSIIVENIFENRFKHACELQKMGANIYIRDRIAVVRGVENLNGAPVDASDLRGGASLVLAGLVAKGYTTISNVHHIERGYDRIDEVLNSLGADVKIIDDNSN